MRVIPLHQLVGRGLWAMIQPHRAFPAIRDDERIPYGRAIAFLFCWGALYALLHFRVMNHNWVWQDPPGIGRCRFLTFFVGNPVAWFVGSLALWQVARWLKHRISLERAEVALWYFWMVWALMPIVDLMHLLGLPKWTFQTSSPIQVSFVAHASWVFAFPVLFVELAAFFRSLGGGALCTRRHFLLGVGLLAICRLLLEPLPQVLSRISYQLSPAHAVGDWWVIVALMAVSANVALGWRLMLWGTARWKAVAAVVVGMGGALYFVMPLRYY